MKIWIIRHAEKHDWPHGLMPQTANFVDNHLLSSKGNERAFALIGYFERLGVHFDTVYYQGIASKGKSHRPYLTVKPLIDHYQLPSKSFAKSNLNQMLAEIKSLKVNNVLLSWSHQQMGEIARSFGFGAEWPKKRYDVTWIINLHDSTMQQLPQLLLYGDESINPL
jgi:broad specificity phosphatase PhoE